VAITSRTARRVAWAAGAVALLLSAVVWLRPSAVGPEKKLDAAAASAPFARASGPTTSPRQPPAARTAEAPSADTPDRGVEALVAALGASDQVMIAEATEALIARRATSSIGALARIDLRAAAGGGASVVHALGRLGAMAGGEGRATAVDRLLVLLVEEKRRGAPESPGNLLQIYEALGDTRDPRAARPLEAELSDATVGRAPKVLLVHALVRIGDERSRPALTRLRNQQMSLEDTDAFEEELRAELLAAIDLALDEL
jgi:hypothetical protein